MFFHLLFKKRSLSSMKLVCSKNSLLKSINISLKAVPSKTTMPILECILVDASASQIKFISNDTELGIETIVEGMILEKGIVAIDAKIFYEIIRRLPDNDVTIESDGQIGRRFFLSSDDRKRPVSHDLAVYLERDDPADDLFHRRQRKQSHDDGRADRDQGKFSQDGLPGRSSYIHPQMRS